MKTNTIQSRNVFQLTFALSIFSCLALGQDCALAQASTPVASNSIASVNGKPIDSKHFEQIIKNNVANGLQDTEQLRTAVKDELIARQVMMQEVAKLGLDKTSEAINGLNYVRENFLIDFLLKTHELKHPITEDMIKAEYDRQLALIGEPSEAMQYLTRMIVTSSEQEAKSVIAELKKGAEFSTLAKARSVDPSKSNGGELGWVLPGQVMPALGTVMVNLKEGAFSQLPIQTQQGWTVLKVEEKRPFKIPTLDESKGVVIQTLQQLERQNYIQDLIKSAKISK
jgi:peptidyl-prolyl cis-trans isomerase C